MLSNVDTLLESLSAPERQLLWAAVILRQFDLSVLAAVLPQPQAPRTIFDWMQHLPGIQPVAKQADWYQIEPALWADLHKKLENEYKRDYIDSCERAVHYYVSKLANSTATEAPTFEEPLFRHLDDLFFPLADGGEADRLERHLRTVTQLTLRQPRHCAYLRYYQAVLRRDRGEHQAAEREFHELLALPESDIRLQARMFNALGRLHDQRSEYDKALRAYTNSAERYRLLQDASAEGKVLKNQGIVYHRIGQYAKALEQFEQSYALAQQAADPVLQVRLALELGYTTQVVGDWERAQTHYKGGLRLAEQQQDGDMLARLYNNLGEVALYTGDWPVAQDHFALALQLFLTPQHQDKSEAADVCHNLGDLAFLQEDEAGAYVYYEQGLALAEEVQNRLAISALHYRLGQLAQHGDHSTNAFSHYHQAISQIERMLALVDEEETRIGIMGIRQHVYQAMVLCCLGMDQTVEAFNHVQRAKSRAFLDLLSTAQMNAVALPDQPLTAPQIQAQLPVGTALVEFFATGQMGPQEQMIEKIAPPVRQRLLATLTPPQKLMAFVLTRTNLEVVQLGTTAQRISKQHFIHASNRLRGTTPLPGTPLSKLTGWRHLNAQLLAGLRPHLLDKPHLCFAPHTVLHYLPLHALAYEAESTLDPMPTISYIASASVLIQAGLNKPHPPGSAFHACSIGYNHSTLSHAEAEATWVAQLLDCDLRTGAQATIATLKQTIVEADVLHVSCHGDFQQARPLDSALQLADGKLTVADVLRLPRLQAKLVTLSACDTGLNHLTYGDELMGFTRAFLGVGVRSLLMTLWPVSELPTRIFMEHFYQVWLNGKGCAAALLAAQRYLRSLTLTGLQQHLERYSVASTEQELQLQQLIGMNGDQQPLNHPYYWAPFVLVGDPA